MSIPSQSCFFYYLMYSNILITGSYLKAHSTNCCSEDKAEAIPKEYRDPSCFPIEVLHDDPHYAQHSQQCMNFVRTTTDLSQGCSQPFKPAEQHWTCVIRRVRDMKRHTQLLTGFESGQ
uniref:Uncharacterized protein n=1 Tax=Timema douglasi TaxID=61478 RepID=A0A7R8ZFS4_TIMDO|nr:unnamed protein product [Timema douglasi]